MQQLGITKLRPGPSGNPDSPNAANTDESKANPYQSSQPFQTIPYSGGQIPDDASVNRNEGCLSQRCSSIPFGNHAWTLSSRTTTAMRSCLCPTLLGELSGQRLTRSVNVLPRYRWPTRRPRFKRTLSVRHLAARFVMNQAAIHQAH